MSDVFVSYAREDQPFVRRLTAALEARGREAWVDWADIPPTAEWMAEIRGAIDAADTYLVVVSPDSISSRICAAELDTAIGANKRIVPVLARDVDDARVPEPVAKVNWVRFDEGFETGVDRLIEALDTDLEHVRGHTKLLVRAREWDQRGEDRSLLLRGRELQEAERWFETSSGKQPAPTPLHTRFILASRRAATRRQRGVVSSVTVMFLVAAVLGIFAWLQRSAAIENESLAERRAAESRSRELAAASLGQLELDPERSLLLASQAMESSRTPEALGSLRTAIEASKVRERFVGHRSHVRTVVASADGSRLLTASFDGTARIWALESEDEPIIFDGHTDLVETAAFSGDGTRIVTASYDGTAKVWDAETGETIATLEGHVGAVHDATFTPNGNEVVTAGSDGTVRLWSAADGEEDRVLLGHSRPVYDVDVSPNGATIATASDDDTVRLWDTATGRQRSVLTGHDDGVYSIAFDGQGRRLVSASEDGTSIVWDVVSGRRVSRVDTGAAVVSASLTENGDKILTASEDGFARIWSTDPGRQLVVFRGHRDELSAATFDEEERLVLTASLDGSARVWDASDGTSLATLRGHVGGVLATTFLPGGTDVATAGEDTTVRVWEPITERLVIRGRSAYTWRDETGHVVTNATNDGVISVMNARTGQERWRVHVGVPQTSVNVSDDGRYVVSGGLDGMGHVWDADTGEAVADLEGHAKTYMAADFFWTDRILTWSDDGTARLWDPRTGRELVVFDHGAAIWEAHLSPDSTRVLTTGSADGNIRMWDAATGEQLWEHSGLLTTGGIGAAFSRDGTLVGTASSKAFVWDVESGERVATLRHPSRALSVGFSGDGERVLSRFEDGAARVWEARTGKVLTTMPGHPGTVNSAGYSDDGRWIVTTADDGHIRVWNAGSGAFVTGYDGAGGATAFAFFAANATVVSDSEAGVVIHRCEVCRDTEALLTLAKARSTRSLTGPERADYLGDHIDREPEPGRTGFAGANGQPVPDGPLAAGTYQVVGFEPSLAVEVPDGWLASSFLGAGDEEEVSLGRLVQLQSADRLSDGISFVMLDPGRVIDGAKDWDERQNILPFPRDFVEFLEAHPHLEVLRTSSASVDGLDGVVVDTLVTSVPADPWPTCGGCVTLLALSARHQTGPLTEDTLVNVLFPGEVDRYVMVRTPGEGTLLINAYAASRADFRKLLPEFRRILAGVTLGDG